jgi:hypothetical protein
LGSVLLAVGTLSTVSCTEDGPLSSEEISAQPGPGVLFFSDWRTGTGNAQNVLTDGGKWDFISADFAGSIVRSTGLDFPSDNVFRVEGAGRRAGWVDLHHTRMPVPAVGESRYYRWYIRVTMPDGLSDDQTHPIQDNYLVNWGFYVINARGPAGVPAGKWSPQFWNEGGPWPHTRFSGPMLDKNVTYRVEMQLHRLTANTWNMHVRIYNTAGTLLYDDDDFRNGDRSASLASNPSLSLVNPQGLNGITAGNNGIGSEPTPPPWPFTISYQGAFCVRSDTWCGAYTGAF